MNAPPASLESVLRPAAERPSWRRPLGNRRLVASASRFNNLDGSLRSVTPPGASNIVTKEQWQKVKSLMTLALEQPPESRRVFLREAAADDAELLDELNALLDAYDRPDGFSLDDPIPLPTNWSPIEDVFPDSKDSGSTYTKICSRCHSRYGPLVFVCPQDGESLADDPSALVGVTLDGLYQIESLIGQGAMGRVYSARHALLRDRVAIKVLRSDLALNAEFVRRFMREGRAARAISHPNAVTVHDLRTTTDGLTYMVQEYIDGRTLRDETTPGNPMPVSRVLEILGPVAAALDEAHSHGVVHRDLKPENVIIGTSGGKRVVKVTDLGIAKLHDTADVVHDVQSELTIPGQIMGTPQYMSPEQWGAPPDDGGPEIDSRADVYSFGVMAFELLAGRKPFEGMSVRQLCLAHLSRPAPDVREFAPDVSESVALAVGRALSKERSARQATCGELVEQLRGSAQLQPATDSRNRWLAVAAAVVLVAAVVTGAFLSRRETASAPVASAPAPPPAALPFAVECSAVIQKYRDGTALKEPMSIAIDKTLVVEQGDRFQMTLSSPTAGFLYVLNETAGERASADLRVLYPVSWANDGSARLVAAQQAALPPAGSNWIEFDGERGTEAFWIVWSVEELPELAGIGASANPRDRGIVDSARAAAIRNMLSSVRPAAAAAEDSRTVIRGESSPLVYRLEIQHY